MHGLTRRHWLAQAGTVFAASSWPLIARAAEIVPLPRKAAVPALVGTDLQGQVWDWTRLRGTPVLLNFWATWCEPCREEMPALQQLAARGDLRVLAVNFKEAAPTAERFAARTGLTLPILLDPEGAIARAWAVRIFPSTILIGSDGRPRWRVRGEFDWTGAEAAALLKTLRG